MGINYVFYVCFWFLTLSAVLGAPSPRRLWDNRNLHMNVEHLAGNGSTTIVSQANTNIKDYSQHETNIGRNSPRRDIEEEDDDNFWDRNMRSRLSDSSSSKETGSFWDNRNLHMNIKHIAKNGSTTIMSQANTNIEDYSRHIKNIGRKSSRRDTEKEDDDNFPVNKVRSRHNDSSSSEEFGELWDNGNLFKNFFHTAEKGSTTIMGQKNATIIDNSKHKTNIFSSSSNECKEVLEDGSCEQLG